MKKRAYKRIPSSLVTKFFHDSSSHYGLVTNISENSMCINAGNCPPVNSKVKLRLSLKEDDLEIPVRVKRVVKTNSFYDIMGVELLDQPKNYLDFIDSLKASL